MTDAAAPLDPGRRPAFGTAFTMAAFLVLAPPLFLLVPLCLLLLFSRPKSGREWFWILASGAGSAWSLSLVAGAPSLEANLVAAFALVTSATFLAMSHLTVRMGPVSRALIAVTVGGAAVALWSLRSGVDLTELDRLVEATLRASIKVNFEDAPAAQIAAAQAAVPLMVRLAPGLVTFEGLIGLGLAWRWYHRVAVSPIPPPSRPFREFRFGDPLVWGAIFTLGLGLVPLGPMLGRAVHSALVVWAGLYLVRGLAVVAAAVRTWSLPARILLAGVSFLALPVALGSLLTLGLADVWVDFRRRAAPHTEGRDTDGSHSP